MSLDPSMSGSALGTSSSSAASSSFVWKYCRMCALEIKQGVYIFGEEGRRLQIPEKIRKTVATLVLEEDSLPKRICTSCCTNLETYAQFKDAVADAQEKLGSIAKSIEKSQEQSLLSLKNKPSLRSPTRPKIYHLSTSSGLQPLLVPAPVPSAAEVEFDDPVEFEEPPSSVISEDDGDDNVALAASEIGIDPRESCSSDGNNKGESDLQEPLQGPMSRNSPPSLSTNKDNTIPIVFTSSERPGPSTPSATFGSQPQQVQIEGTCASMEILEDNSPEIGESDGDTEGSDTEVHLSCGLCTFIAKDKESIIAHQYKSHKMTEYKDPVFGCSACPRISSNYEAIRQHLYRHRKSGTHKCTDCEKSYPTKDQLHVHISSKHNPSDAKAFDCCTCGKKFSTKIALAAHKRRKHSRVAAEGVTDHSHHGVAAEQHKSLDIEQSSDESSMKPAATTAAASYGISPASGSHEQREMHQSQNSSLQPLDCHQDDPSKLCSLSKGVASSPNLNTKSFHDLRTDVPTKNADVEGKDGFWKCDYCEKIFQSKHGFDRHIATHKGRRFSCVQCGVTYTQKSTLEHHVKVHHTNLGKEFECPECKKRFKTFRQLSWHKKIHEKPLTDVKCPQCDKKFLNMISLKTHMKLHRGSKRFTCSACPKSFYTKLKLQEHINSHTGNRPFGCVGGKCSKSFSCYSNYAKHFKKHHADLLGPKGRMIPQPKMIDESSSTSSSNDVSVATKSKDHKASSREVNTPVITCPDSHAIKDSSVTNSVIANKIGAHTSFSQSPQILQGESSHAHHGSGSGPTLVHHIPLQPTISQISAPLTVPKSISTTISNPLLNSTSGMSFLGNPSREHAVFSSSANSATHHHHPHSHPMTNSGHHPTSSNTMHSSHILSSLPSSNISSSGSIDSTNTNIAHSNNNHNVAIPGGPSMSHSHHHPLINIQNMAHSAPAHSTPIQSHQTNQFQPQTHIQSVWQPVVVPGSKVYHHTNSSTGLSTLSGLDLLDCAAIAAHPGDSLTSTNNHSHGQQAPGNLNLIQIPVATAHHHSSNVHIAHHNSVSVHSSMAPSGHVNTHGAMNNHSHTHTSPSHSNGNLACHSSIPISSSAGVTVPNFVPSHQNEPMELSYKLEANNFQDMPMELTKVFQRDPLELCVRQEFATTQPLMDLSSRVVNVTVGGNSSINGSTMSGGLNGNNNGNAITSNHINNSSHYGSISSGSGATSTSTTVLSVPYHKTVDIVERELSLNDFTGAFRQPIDLIARSDDQSHELCSEGNLVDLSLRSSFGQDQSASSFLRELIDLSSRSDSFHGEINLTNKQHQSPPTSHPQGHIHPQNHASTAHHPISKPSSGQQNNNNNHHHHHHHHPPLSQVHPHPASSAGGSVHLHNVIYPDPMFIIPN